MKKIKELQKRSLLGEGRNFGIGFAILNKIDDDNYETFNAFTACKDYLNDFSYVEHTKKEIGSIYGYNHKLKNCFDNQEHFYLGVNTLHYQGGQIWKEFDDCKKILIDNYKNLQKVLNTLEKKLNLPTKSKIEIDEDTLIIKAPIYWTKTTALISVYTLIIRCFFNISKFTKTTFEEVFKNNKAFISADNYLIGNCIKFNQNIELKYDELYYNEFKISSAGSVHNFGISGYFNRPEIKKLLNDK